MFESMFIVYGLTKSYQHQTSLWFCALCFCLCEFANQPIPIIESLCYILYHVYYMKYRRKNWKNYHAINKRKQAKATSKAKEDPTIYGHGHHRKRYILGKQRGITERKRIQFNGTAYKQWGTYETELEHKQKHEQDERRLCESAT